MEVTLDEVVDLVRRWLADATRLAPDPAARRLAGLLADPAGLDFTTDFVDGVIRPEDNQVAAHRLAEVAAAPPAFLTGMLRGAVSLGGVVAPVVPGVVIPLARAVLRRMLGHLVLDARPAPLGRALRRIRSTGVVPNLSLLGEAVLGDGQVGLRLATQRQLLARDDVGHLSVKVSGALGPHAPWGFDEAVTTATDRLRPLFTAAGRTGHCGAERLAAAGM